MAEDKDNVSLTHTLYDDTIADREAFNNALGGTKLLRANSAKLLPKFPLEHADDYKTRCNTATALNVTEKTLDTLVGLVFQKPVTLGEDVPEQIVSIAENIDNKGNSINVAARELFRESFDGWAVWLVDIGQGKGADASQVKGKQPYIALYKADAVTNWDWSVNPISGKLELSMIVLRECSTVRSGTFKREEQVYYLACFLENGVASWIRYQETKDAKGKVDYIIVGEGIFEKQTQLPVAIVGMLGDKPPLLDLAHKNFEHSQTYSDYKSIIHKTCVPLPFTTGLDASEANKAIDGGLMWHLPADGTIGFAEVAGASIATTRTALEDIKTDMAWLGLQMLMPSPKGGSQATATEVISDTLQDTSALQVRAEQLKDALEQAFKYMANYLGISGDSGGSIDLGCSWQQMVLSPQDLQVWNTMCSDGNISLETFLWKLERAGMLPPDVTAKDEAAAVEKEQKESAPIKNAVMMPNEKGVTNGELSSSNATSGE